MTERSAKDFNIPISLREEDNIVRHNEPVRTGIPFAKGLLSDTSHLRLTSASGTTLPCQTKSLEHWPDGSLKWVLIDFLADIPANGALVFHIEKDTSQQPSASFPLHIEKRSDSIGIETGGTKYTVNKRPGTPLLTVARLADSVEVPVDFVLKDKRGQQIPFNIQEICCEDHGPLHCAVRQEGQFVNHKGVPFLNAVLVHHFYAGSTFATCDVTLHNPQAARHPGGLWDLGDSGSIFIQECSLMAKLPAPAERLIWQTSQATPPQEAQADKWQIFQDSSGGDHWNSPNHVDGNNDRTVSFPGFRLSYEKDNETTESTGGRATPFLLARSPQLSFGAAILDFWQNFPKSIHLEGDRISLSLFPPGTKSPHEIQGGEQKRHTLFFQTGNLSEPNCLPQLLSPVTITIDPQWLAETKAIAYLSDPRQNTHPEYQRYIENIIEGTHSFFNKREVIDEYGWRNYGDTYADHEAVHHQDPAPFISHYNNQYDFIYGACIHSLRSADRRWRSLATSAARHMIDIDIYHTHQDRAAYNGGLFWHSDHYLQAKTASHRAYSIKNKTNPGYGGGTSNEHIYSSGLTLYYYLTGDTAAKAAVLELADYAINMDDGSKTIFALFDEGATGLASQTVDTAYHHPGRGPGNCINCLIDAYRLSRQRCYFSKAEELLQRCIHPGDNVEALSLADPEYRWSYLVFLQILGKYLDYKSELGELDYHFFYARDSLLHYAVWMAKNEVPYKDVLHKVLIPTETWPAHDIRKCHIFHMAAKYGPADDRQMYGQKAEYFFTRCIDDLLGFTTAFLARPLIILSVYGYIHEYFLQQGYNQTFAAHYYDFGKPQDFLPQRLRFKKNFLKKIRQTFTLAFQLIQDKFLSKN